MAPVKRPYDVISIASGSSEDDVGQLARPYKIARQHEPHWRPGLDIDEYVTQNDLHTNDLEEWMAARDREELIRTGDIKGKSAANYDIDEWIAENDRLELLRTNPIMAERNDDVNQAEPGALATHPHVIDSDDLEFDPPFQFDFDNPPYSYVEIPNSMDDPIIAPEATPTPERSPLDLILDVVPDVSHDHVTQMLVTHHDNVEGVLDMLLEGDYPKESDKRAAEQAARETALQEQKAAEEARMESLLNPQCILTSKMKDIIIEVLKDEFNTIPVKYIRGVQKDKKYLYATYLALNEAKHAEPCPYGKSPWRANREVNFEVLQANKHETANIPHIKEQFESARKAAIESNSQRRRTITQKVREEMEAAARAKEEQSALEAAKATGTVVECSACYDEYAPNKVIKCGSTHEHHACFECMKTYLGSEVGQSSSTLACPSGCGETFREPQLRLIPDADTLVDKLMQLRQEHDLRTAGIDDIESCPFCDFKTVCPPIHIDFEFHCQFSTCNITSCRKCKDKTHIPDSCEENQRKRSKESALGLRRTKEEAMSNALIRHCNKCKQPFIKSDGCNKMTCSACKNLQCYLCGVNVTADYAHFNAPGSKCPVYSQDKTLEELHAEEVKAAAEAAEAKILRENPEIDKSDLGIKFFDDPAEAGRRQGELDIIGGPLRAEEVAQLHRHGLWNHRARGPAPDNNRVPQFPALAGDHRAPYDPVAAVQAARYRVGPVAAYNPQAQQPNPVHIGGFHDALGQFGFGFNDQLRAPQIDHAEVRANVPGVNDVPQVPVHLPQMALPPVYRAPRVHRENNNRRQGLGGRLNNLVQNRRANLVRFAPLPGPIPAQLPDFNNNPGNNFDFPMPLW